MNQSISPKPWWGEFSLREGQRGQWQVGALTVSVQQLASEWHICQLNTDAQESCEVAFEAEPLPDSAKCHRHLVKPSSRSILVLPALADRPIVTRPLTPFNLYPGQKTVLYVGTTLWLQIYTHRAGDLMLDIPVQRPSDTWFGASTREGEICYAARTRAILDLNEVPIKNFRAITPVSITNEGKKPLPLERLMLPIPHLSLFSGSDGRLWTEELSILCDEDMRSAHLHLGKGTPAVAKNAEKLAAPRVPADLGVFTKAFSSIFG